jgi:nicotinate-nucleotide adenylyltransferase
MVEAAVEGVEGLEAGRWEIDHGGPSYTADTLEALARMHPDATFFTIVGDDAAAGLTTWERLADVVATSEIVVVDRPGAFAPVPEGVPCRHVEVPHLDVSSTDLRRRFTDGRPLDFLVTPPVMRVISERSLYAEPAGSRR